MDLDVLAKHARDLMSFKGELETAMPEIRKALADASSLAADIASIKETLGPALEWIAEQQKAIDAAKAAEQQKVDDAAKALELHNAPQDEGAAELIPEAVPAAVEPAEPATEPEKAEVEPSAVQEAATEQPIA